ncbi:MAG: multidrug effflux MFS transporter [Pseudomonadota bacterium]
MWLAYQGRITTPELIVLLGSLISLGALTQDIMLPALALMNQDLGAGGVNNAQYVITASLLGLGVGQLFYGPVSDSWGRRRTLFLGLGIYVLGSVICACTDSFGVLLAGRVLQGLGAASPRVLSISIARDLYEGRAMAQIVSYIMSIQMMTPVFAPALGQYLAIEFGWAAIFLFLIALAGICGLWFGIRMPETLPADLRRVFSWRKLGKDCLEVFSNSESAWHAVALGLSMGSVIGFIISSPQIFADVYGITTLFPLYFGMLCLALAFGSLINAWLVTLVSLNRLCQSLMLTISAMSLVGLSASHLFGGSLSSSMFLMWSALTFLCSGALFGNLNTIAMKPLGHLAGAGAAVVGALSTFIYVGFGTLVGQAYDGTVLPVVSGFLVSGSLAFWIVSRSER